MKYLFAALVCITIVLTSCSSSDNGPDTQSIVGCMDSNAVNYNPNATESDGSCAYPTPYTLEVPQLFLENILPPVIPANNPLSVEEYGAKMWHRDNDSLFNQLKFFSQKKLKEQVFKLFC